MLEKMLEKAAAVRPAAAKQHRTGETDDDDNAGPKCLLKKKMEEDGFNPDSAVKAKWTKRFVNRCSGSTCTVLLAVNIFVS